jgi:transposase, IS605 orfB family|nr:MAG TPA: endonuclease [Caudoviricetes sp.]
MEIYKTFKFRIKPTKQQIIDLTNACYCARYVYNRALGYHNLEYKESKENRFNAFKLMGMLPDWKREKEWLSNAPSQVLQQAIKNLERAMKNYFNQGATYPSFKKRNFNTSIKFPQSFKIDEDKSKFYLPKIGWVKYSKSRNIEGEVKNIVIKRSCGRWYATLQCLVEINQFSYEFKSLGIDLGIKNCIATSDGELIQEIRAYRDNETKLVKLQRKLERQIRGSSNYRKQLLKLSKLHEHIRNKRHHLLHRITKEIANNNSHVFIENVTSRELLQQDFPAKRHKTNYNKALNEQGWWYIKTFLKYKLEWQGKHLIIVDRFNSSIECNKCSYISESNRVARDEFICCRCGIRIMLILTQPRIY